MKSLLSLIAVSCLCLAILLVGCETPATTTSSPFVTTPSPSGTTYPPSSTTYPPSSTTPSPSTTTPSPSNTSSYPGDIFVEIPLCLDDPEHKIVIDSVTITSGVLDRDYYTPASGQHVAGEPCFLIVGNIQNNYNEDCWVAYHIEGFDASDNRASTTLETGPLPGWGQVYLAAQSSMPFTLHLNWADNVRNFLIYSQRTTRAVPSPSPTNISITIEPPFDDTEGKIRIYDVTVVASTLDRDYFTTEYKAGDPCFLLSAIIANDYNENYWVYYSAHGFDSAGNQVSRTLEAGPIVGVDMVYIYAGSAEYITLHLNWADNVTNIIFNIQMSSITPP
jgi:hypothetical protein